MIIKCRRVVLAVACVQGVVLTAMEDPQQKKRETSYSIPLSCSAELRIKSAALRISPQGNNKHAAFNGWGNGRKNSPEAPYCYGYEELLQLQSNSP